MPYLLIIGAKSDIAKAVAIKYAKHGYDLYLAARNSAELQQFANDITIRMQRRITITEFDILDYENHQSFYDQFEEKPLGVISVVGYLGDQRRAQTDFCETQRIIDTNYTAIVCLLNIIANDLEQRRSGFIVAISSVAGDRGRKRNCTYGSAKAALSTYLSGLRNRLHEAKVQVLTVKPGFVATKMTQGMDLPKQLTAQPEQVAEDIYKAQQKGKSVIYTQWIWRYIMLIIKIIPERLFKRMSI